MMPSEIFNEKIILLKSKIESEGVFATIKKMVQLVYETIVNKIFKIDKFIISEKVLDKKIKIIQPKISATYKRINIDHLEELKGKVIDTRLDLFADRIKNNVYGIVVIVNNEIAAYSWLMSKEEKNKIGLYLSIKEDEVILKDGFVFPDYRRNGLQIYMKSILLKLSQEKKHKKVLAAFYEWNYFSRKAYLRNDFEETKKVYLLSIIGLKIQYSRKILPKENIKYIAELENTQNSIS